MCFKDKLYTSDYTQTCKRSISSPVPPVLSSKFFASFWFSVEQLSRPKMDKMDITREN
jgi:hypothetical protein